MNTPSPRGAGLLNWRALALQAGLVSSALLVAGWLVLKPLQASLEAQDHALLQQQAQWLLQPDGAQAPIGAAALQQRLDSLRRLYPALRIQVVDEVVDEVVHEAVDGRPDANPRPPSVAPDPTWPVRGMLMAPAADPSSHPAASARADVLELRLPVAGQAPSTLRLMLLTAPREAALRQQARWLLAAGLIGLALSTALSALALRWSGGRLRRLSREARAAVQGGRLSTARVDPELRELVQAFNSTLDQLTHTQRQAEGFSADVAHELRSPLATLIGGTQFVLSRARSAPQLREALVSNLEELERLTSMVNDMLFLARADRGERAQSLARCDLGPLGDAMLAYCSALLDEAGLQARRQGEASAVCNPALVRRAIANLLSNAIRHAQGDAPIELHLQARPGRVRVWVFNAGPPLPDEVAARMFDRFFRASAARTDHGAHHGLGLSIVQAVARMHGGEVFARAEPGGNAIGFEIPSALASAQVRVRDAVHEAPR